MTSKIIIQNGKEILEVTQERKLMFDKTYLIKKKASLEKQLLDVNDAISKFS